MRKLTKLRVDEVSSVTRGAGEDCRVVLMKRYDPNSMEEHQPLLFNDAMRKADVDDPLRGPREEDDDKKLSDKLDEIVAEMVVAAPSLHPQRARRWLMHTDQGRALLSKLITQPKEQPMDIAKIIAITEEALLARAPDARSFSKLYETDIAFRKQWATLTDAKHLLALGKGLASLVPTSVEVGSSQTSDDSAEAIRLLNEMAVKNGQSFEQVFAHPDNRKLAAATYPRRNPDWHSAATGTSSRGESSTSGSELQR